jgi:uncharacterized protein YndB with AHSA1/START domain
MEKTNTETANRELRISRILHAPLSLVWEVWTDPAHIVNWWGPNGFKTTIHKMDMVENGEWLLTMHGPDGTNYPNRSIFKEIQPMEKIVFQHFNPGFITTVTFKDLGATTELNWHMLFDTKELYDAVVKAHNADEGLKQNVAKLEHYLSQKQSTI